MQWIREYPPLIARQPKGFGEVNGIIVGDLVGVRNSWIRGRIIRVYSGLDGGVHSAYVQTSFGFIRRPVTKFAVLDVAREAGTA